MSLFNCVLTWRPGRIHGRLVAKCIAIGLIFSSGTYAVLPSPANASAGPNKTTAPPKPLSRTKHQKTPTPCGTCAAAKKSTPETNKVEKKDVPDKAHAAPDAVQPADMFVPQSWYVPPPPPAPVVLDSVPVPTAPPLQYSYVGSFTPAGERPTYFLARGDRVIDAHIGDKLDGTLLFEKVEGGQLVFTYLPLNIQQTLPVGAIQ